MILGSIAFNFLMGFVIGFWTGFNKYKMYFIVVFIMALYIIVLSQTSAVIGGTQTTTLVTQSFFRWATLLEGIWLANGLLWGSILKHKSKGVNK